MIFLGNHKFLGTLNATLCISLELEQWYCYILMYSSREHDAVRANLCHSLYNHYGNKASFKVPMFVTTT